MDRYHKKRLIARYILLKKGQQIIQLNAGLNYNRCDDNLLQACNHIDAFGTFIAIRPHNHKSYFIMEVKNW